MLKGFDKNGNIQNVILNEDGSIPVQMSNGGAVEVVQTSDQETVLNASIVMLSTEVHTITVNKKLTVISIANYSDTADITMTIGTKTYQIGAGLAIDFPINEVVESISLVSTSADTKTQLVIKGVE